MPVFGWAVNGVLSLAFGPDAR